MPNFIFFLHLTLRMMGATPRTWNFECSNWESPGQTRMSVTLSNTGGWQDSLSSPSPFSNCSLSGPHYWCWKPLSNCSLSGYPEKSSLLTYFLPDLASCLPLIPATLHMLRVNKPSPRKPQPSPWPPYPELPWLQGLPILVAMDLRCHTSHLPKRVAMRSHIWAQSVENAQWGLSQPAQGCPLWKVLGQWRAPPVALLIQMETSGKGKETFLVWEEKKKG